LEERGFARFHACVAGGNEDIERGNGTSAGGSSNFLSEDNVAGLVEVIIGEDEADVA